MLNDELISWLLEGEPWVQYRTRIDLLGQPEHDPDVAAARLALIHQPQIQQIIAELSGWPGAVLKSHKDAGHPIHKLAFLADLGLTAEDPGMDPIIREILSHSAAEGPFQVLTNIPIHFGGSGQDQYLWMLCDAPLIIYSLAKFGLDRDPRLQPANQYLLQLVRDNGWPCAASPQVGKFRGPGRKDDPCPYANLVMLKVLALLPEHRDHPASRIGTETLLSLWTDRKQRKPYLFGMGTDFGKIKAPLIWYDLLNLLEVLSQFPHLKDDPRVGELAGLLQAKMDSSGRFTPESVWMAWKGWDFGQKKLPSRWLTFLAIRILKRLDLF